MRSESLIRFKIILTILIVVFVSCKNKKVEDQIFNWVGKKIRLIDTLPVYNSFDNTYCTFNSFNLEQEKIIIFINGNCFTCAEDLVLWKRILDEVKGKNVQVLIYLFITDFKVLEPYLKKWNFSYPIILDRNNLFFTTNEISDKQLFQVMLLNENNTVIFVGNPLKDKNIENFYLNHLK